jgi:RNA polymerase sigma-70 factor (ECF subfamily)
MTQRDRPYSRRIRVDTHQLIQLAKSGQQQPLGKLLETYRNYLKLLAAARIKSHLQVRVSPSDVVQETFLRAHVAIAQFRGQTEEDFLAWLRQILASRLADACELHLIAEKRDARREVSLNDIGVALERSTARLEAVLADKAPSPSTLAQRQENVVMLADEMARLSEDQRQVLVLRNLEGLSFPEVAERMSRSPGAVRMLWFRAIHRLRDQLAARGLI